MRGRNDFKTDEMYIRYLQDQVAAYESCMDFLREQMSAKDKQITALLDVLETSQVIVINAYRHTLRRQDRDADLRSETDEFLKKQWEELQEKADEFLKKQL